jgi:shikimate dehydrogenase
MPDRYVVIGHPISHSKSPLIHGVFAVATAQDIDYGAIDCPIGHFRQRLAEFFSMGGRGVNVTAPFKLEACRLASALNPRAELAGAANTLKLEGGIIIGDNFDGVGLVNDIQHCLGLCLRGRRVLLLGAGGAARGALLPLLEQRPSLLLIVNRTLIKAASLASQFRDRGPIRSAAYDDLADDRFDLIVNATSASIAGESLPLPPGVFAGAGLAYELLYGKGLTPFLRQAQAAGVAGLADGVGMLVEQAAEAFTWWRGVRPDTRPVRERLTVPLI